MKSYRNIPKTLKYFTLFRNNHLNKKNFNKLPPVSLQKRVKLPKLLELFQSRILVYYY